MNPFNQDPMHSRSYLLDYLIIIYQPFPLPKMVGATVSKLGWSKYLKVQ